MSRRRYISTEMGFDLKLKALVQECGEFGVLLYTWMIPHAEDDGIIKGNAEAILGRVMPIWRWVEADAVAEALNTMHRLGLVQWDGEKAVFPAEKFYAYQNYIKTNRRRSENDQAFPSSSEIFQEVPRISTQNPAPHSHSHSLPHSHPHSSAAAELAFEAGTTNEAQVEAISEFLEWGMEADAIRHGIKMTRERGKPFGYLRAILDSWKKQGLKTLESVKGERREPEPPKPSGPRYRPAEEVLREQGIEI